MNIEEVIKENIRKCMTEQFYIEGQDKDYYFGKSELNDNLTVFYNNIESEKAVQCLENAVCNSIQTAFRMVDEKKYGLRHHSNTHFSLSSSAFMIPMGYFGSRWWDIDGRYGNEEIIGYQINYMPSGALDEAIKNNPERWALYKKYRDKISK